METQNIVLVVLTAGWALSEALALIPAVKANSVFQLARNIVGTLIASRKKEAD